MGRLVVAMWRNFATEMLAVCSKRSAKNLQVLKQILHLHVLSLDVAND